MNPTQHVTPETGKLLEESGLINKVNCLFVWIGDTKYKVVPNDGYYTNSEDWFIPAPTLGEIVKKYKELFLIEELYRIGNCLMEDNEAECLAKRLLQLHKDGKL